MSDLSELQQLFPLLVADLIGFAYHQGYALSFGECYRTPEQAALNAKAGTGISGSLHGERLAIDFNLYKDGVWQTQSEAHRPLGNRWKGLHPLARWGGDFKTRPDGNHYSLAYGGRA